MKGYILVQKDKGRPIRIAVQNDQGEFVDVLVWASKKELAASVNLEDDEEIRRIEI